MKIKKLVSNGMKNLQNEETLDDEDCTKAKHAD